MVLLLLVEQIPDLVTGEINVDGADTIHDRRLKGSVKCGVSDT